MGFLDKGVMVSSKIRPQVFHSFSCDTNLSHITISERCMYTFTLKQLFQKADGMSVHYEEVLFLCTDTAHITNNSLMLMFTSLFKTNTVRVWNKLCWRSRICAHCLCLAGSFLDSMRRNKMVCIPFEWTGRRTEKQLLVSHTHTQARLKKKRERGRTRVF